VFGRKKKKRRPDVDCCLADSIFDCFVATAAFEDYEAPEVRTLRAYRDEVLSQSISGRTFTRVYYYAGRYPAAVIRGRPRLQRAGRRALAPVVRHAARRLGR